MRSAAYLADHAGGEEHVAGGQVTVHTSVVGELLHPAGDLRAEAVLLVPAKKRAGNTFRVGIFLDFVSSSTRTPRWGVRADEQTENKLTTINLTLVQKARFTYSVKGQPSAARFWSAAWSSPCSA